MLRLVQCEFLKLKRKKFVVFVIVAAFLFPIPGTALMINENRTYDFLFNFIIMMGVPLLLPIVVGIVGTMLFFMERDNDVLKNLRTVPVSVTQLVIAKITVLFIYGMIFAVFTLVGSVIGGLFVGEIQSLGEKFGVAILSGLMVTAGSLPLLILVVALDKSYIVSILISCFYAFLNYYAIYLLSPDASAVHNLIVGLIPGVMFYKWNVIHSPGEVMAWIRALAVSTPVAVIYFIILAVACTVIAIAVYKRQEVK